MDNIIDDLVRIARRCERAGKVFDADPLKSVIENLLKAAGDLGRAWCGSWIGYHSTIYLKDFANPTAHDVFDREWGGTDLRGFVSQTKGNWLSYTYELVEAEVLCRVGVSDWTLINAAAKAAGEVFVQSRDELMPTLDAIIATHNDTVLRTLREKLDGLEDHYTRADFVESVRPTTFSTRDSRAANEGIRAPHHIVIQATIVEKKSHGTQVIEIARIARHAARYLEQRFKMKGETIAKSEGKIFIGHGRSLEWRNLKDYLRDRLHLDVDEFNMQSAAGLSTKERLEQMLDDAVFAFLVMTAEDEQQDGKKRARENVVHEAGLFQGRLGFRRAILLVENGCEEFSNIHGIMQIRFDASNMRAAFDEVRHVLEREGIIN